MEVQSHGWWGQRVARGSCWVCLGMWGAWCTELPRVGGGLGCARTLWIAEVTSPAVVPKDVFCVETAESRKLLVVHGLLHDPRV